MANPITAPTIAEIALVTYRGVKNGSAAANPVPHFPLPSQYVSVAVIYGILGLAPDRAAKVAGLVGWGFVVATLLNLFQPGGTVAQVNAIQSSTENPTGPTSGTSGGSVTGALTKYIAKHTIGAQVTVPSNWFTRFLHTIAP